MIRDRLTVYSSPTDKALFVSKFLFRSRSRSRSRVGQLSLAELTDETFEKFEKWGKLDIIVYEGEITDLFGHAYFVSNPKVSSDLIQFVRYGKGPGDPGRGLKKLGVVAWTFVGSALAAKAK